jgi:hypothetical protein
MNFSDLKLESNDEKLLNKQLNLMNQEKNLMNQEKQTVEININDLNFIIGLLSILSKRSAFIIDEYEVVGKLYKNLVMLKNKKQINN